MRGSKQKGDIIKVEAEERLNVMIGPLLSGGSSVAQEGLDVTQKLSGLPSSSNPETTGKINVLNLVDNVYKAVYVTLINNKLYTKEGDPLSVVFREP